MPVGPANMGPRAGVGADTGRLIATPVRLSNGGTEPDGDVPARRRPRVTHRWPPRVRNRCAGLGDLRGLRAEVEQNRHKGRRVLRQLPGRRRQLGRQARSVLSMGSGNAQRLCVRRGQRRTQRAVPEVQNDGEKVVLAGNRGVQEQPQLTALVVRIPLEVRVVPVDRDRLRPHAARGALSGVAM